MSPEVDRYLPCTTGTWLDLHTPNMGTTWSRSCHSSIAAGEAPICSQRVWAALYILLGPHHNPPLIKIPQNRYQTDPPKSLFSMDLLSSSPDTHVLRKITICTLPSLRWPYHFRAARLWWFPKHVLGGLLLFVTWTGGVWCRCHVTYHFWALQDQYWESWRDPFF